VHSRVGSRFGQAGFTYLGVLLAVALIGLGLVTASEVWVTVAHRQKLEQLDFAGQQIAQAIGSYYESTPGAAKQFPRSLDDLVKDLRYPNVRRHLRQVYANPFSGKPDWQLLSAPGGGVVGVSVQVLSPTSSPETREYRYSPSGG
jgi:type II secretory pathway pseudopilin PulG